LKWSFRIKVTLNGEDLLNVKLGPSQHFPGTISVKGVAKKDSQALALVSVFVILSFLGRSWGATKNHPCGIDHIDCCYLFPYQLEEGDRVTHVNDIPIRGDVNEVRKAIIAAGNNKTVDVQFMRKNNPFIQKPYHSEDGRAHM